MKSRPFTCSAREIRALLDGTMTQARRIGKIQSPSYTELGCSSIGHQTKGRVIQATHRAFPGRGTARWAICECPYGIPGDELVVREGWRWFGRHRDGRLDGGFEYRADLEKVGFAEHSHMWEDFVNASNRPNPWRWRPGICMPKYASRLTLEIVAVRVERLNAISEADAKAEGAIPTPFERAPESCYIAAYRDLWNEIHGKGSWEANPWVWILELRRKEAK